MTAETYDKQERRLKKAKIALMRNPLFAQWSGVMMVGHTEVRDDFPTACTNGRDEIYGRKFLKELDDKEIAFVVLHENLHKMFKHLYTWRKLHDENPMMANAAVDYVINLMLVGIDPNEQVISVPKKDGKVYGLLDKRFANMNAKQVFDILKKENPPPQKGQSQGGQGDPDHGGFDQHDWDGAEELTEAEKQQLEKDIDGAIRQGQIAANKLCGKGAGDMDRAIGEVLEPYVDWRELLREFVRNICNAKDTSSWRRVNRRFIGQDIYLPTMVGERVGHLAIGVDTSGSIGGDEINRFLSEIKSIAEDVHPERIDLIYWDSVVAGHEQYDEGNLATLVESTKPRGGGGTDPTAMMKFLKKEGIKPDCIIMLTDGCIGDWGSDWDAPILWAVSNAYSSITAPVGKTIPLKD